MNIPSSTTLRIFQPAPGAVYTIETVARITQVPRHQIAVYCRHGLITPLLPSGEYGWLFDHEAVSTLRRLEDLRVRLGVNLPALRLIVGLLDEVDHLRAELRGRRGQ